MMTAEQLKGAILQLAIQGKLVEQRMEEGTGEELYKKILSEKQRLVKEGKIKKDKKLAAITDDEIPFEIPVTWTWARVQDVCTKLVDGDHNPPKGINGISEYIMASSRNINQDRLIDLDQVRYLDKEVFIKENERTLASKGDIFFTSVGSLGRSCVFEGTINICFQRSVSVITTLLYNYYLKCCFDSGYFQNKVNKEATGTAQKGFYLNQLAAAVIPIPPIAEQKRIVAKFEELMPFVKQYEAASTKLNTLNTTFPDQMKKSILQEAIQGKLVPQDSNDEPASVLLKKIAEEKNRLIKEGKIKKQKPLPEITEDEIPFDIPESWEWVRLQDLAEAIVDCPHSTPKYLEETTGYYALGTKGIGSEGKIRGYFNVDKETYMKRIERLEPQENDIVYSREGSIICRAAILPKNLKICLGQRVMLIRCPKYIAVEYLQQYLMVDSTIALLTKNYKGVGVKHINVADVCKLIVPVPPISEQRRIVAELKHILPMIGALKK